MHFFLFFLNIPISQIQHSVFSTSGRPWRTKISNLFDFNSHFVKNWRNNFSTLSCQELIELISISVSFLCLKNIQQFLFYSAIVYRAIRPDPCNVLCSVKSLSRKLRSVFVFTSCWTQVDLINLIRLYRRRITEYFSEWSSIFRTNNTQTWHQTEPPIYE